MLVTSFWLVDTILLSVITVYLLVKYISRNYDYWKKKGVPYIEPKPIFGNIYDVSTFKINMGEYLNNLYIEMSNEKFFGIFVFDKPFLVFRCPHLIKQILVKDFQYFSDRAVYAGNHEPMSKGMLFFNKNPEWKVVRAKMTPVFTSGKLKNMLPLMKSVGEEMQDYIHKKTLEPCTEVKEVCAKYSTDVVAKCAFAIHAHSFDQDDADFRKIGRMIFDMNWRNGISQTAHFYAPGLVKLFKMPFLDQKATDFMVKAFWKAIEVREKSGVKGNDLIDAIIELRKNKDFCQEIGFEGDKVVSQAGQFFVAGFETTSSTMAFTLYELCLHPEIQSKVRAEIKKILEEDGEFTYENIQNMKYLHMCVSETLRKYPVLPFLDRRCNTNYKIPGTDIVIEKGTPVYIPMFGLHYDPEFFPNPEKYDPERFSEENLSKIKSFSYLPFGEGPRNCIGERFGMMATKLGLIYILSEFTVERTSETPVPLEYETKTFLLASKIGLPMKFSLPVTTAG